MSIKQRLLRLEAACLSAKPAKRVALIVLKKDQQKSDGLREYMQLHNLTEEPRCVLFEIVHATQRPQT